MPMDWKRIEILLSEQQTHRFSIGEMKKHFDLISIGILVLLGPLFVFPKDKWNWVLLAAVSVFFFGRWIIERRFLPKTPIDVGMALLLVMAFGEYC